MLARLGLRYIATQGWKSMRLGFTCVPISATSLPIGVGAVDIDFSACLVCHSSLASVVS